MMTYLNNVGTGLSLFTNSVLGGNPYQPISARCYDLYLRQYPFSVYLVAIVDSILGENHCEQSHDRWLVRKQSASKR